MIEIQISDSDSSKVVEDNESIGRRSLPEIALTSKTVILVTWTNWNG